ncbi:hypothetical protein AAG906_041194 [Vitis piasezkii]
MTNFLATVLIFLINARGQQGSYPIKLFYTSNMPIILQFALLLHRRYSGNFLVNLLGKLKESEYSGGQYIYGGGLASLADMAANPFHAFFYILFMLAALSRSSATNVVKQLKHPIPISSTHARWAQSFSLGDFNYGNHRYIDLMMCKAPRVGVATMVMLASRTGMDLANQVLIL